MTGFNRVYYDGRAPLFTGNHFEEWNGGVHIKAVDEVIKDMCTTKDIDRSSLNELGARLDARKPVTLVGPRRRDPAQSPDWSTTVR